MEKKTKQFIIIGLAVAIIIAILAPFLASDNPDGLESAIEKILLPGAGEENIHESPMPDYTIPFLGETPISGSIAIIIGVIVTFALAYGLGYLLKSRKKS